MNATKEAAEFIVNKAFSDFPKDAIYIAKYAILDSLGRMVSGVREPVTQAVIDHAKESGGVDEAGVLGGGFKSCLTNAAFINGTSAHSQELESIGLYTGSNPMTNIPVAFPVADKLGLPGKAILEGFIIGLEVQTKLGMSCPGTFDQGFSSIPTFGTFGATTTACKMMRLDIGQVRNAFGLAASQCAGLQRQTGTMTHLLESGLGCRNGVTAALLARNGITSDNQVLDGEGGFGYLYSRSGKGYNLEGMGKKLGNPWVINSPGIFIKKYGCCFFIHRALDALFELIEEHDIEEKQVEKVQVDVPTWFPKLIKFPQPVNGAEAKFSMEHSLGAGLVDKRVSLPYVRPFTDEGAVEPAYQAARQKVRVFIREDWAGGRSAPWSLPVTVELKNGKTYSKTVDKVKGGPDRPLSDDEYKERFRVLTEAFLSSEQIKRSIDLILNLEVLDSKSVAELMKILTFGAGTKPAV